MKNNDQKDQLELSHQKRNIVKKHLMSFLRAFVVIALVPHPSENLYSTEIWMQNI